MNTAAITIIINYKCTQDLFDDYECMCGEGFFGRRCETAVDPCLPRPCQNGANCSKVSGNDYQCTCPEDFDVCTFKKACTELAIMIMSDLD